MNRENLLDSSFHCQVFNCIGIKSVCKQSILNAAGIHFSNRKNMFERLENSAINSRKIFLFVCISTEHFSIQNL